MRVLIACTRYEGRGANLYLPELVAALKKRQHQVTWSDVEFWLPTKEYDIVHFQWPEGVLPGCSNETGIAAIRGRIKWWKDVGAKLVLTRHNEGVHYAGSDFSNKLYDYVESSCDLIVHMGEYSKRAYCDNHPDRVQHHVVIPHHIYPSVNRSISKADARKILKWDTDEKIVLAFGNIRADEERILIMSAMRNLRKGGVKVIAPRLFQKGMRNLCFVDKYVEFRNRARFFRYGLFLGNYGSVDVDTMANLFAASDIVLIPRIHILNSGNLTMGFYFGKVVVGPNIGNVGEILKSTGNPTFDPNDRSSVVEAIHLGLNLCEKGLGISNQQYADSIFSPLKVADLLISSYKMELGAK